MCVPGTCLGGSRLCTLGTGGATEAGRQINCSQKLPVDSDYGAMGKWRRDARCSGERGDSCGGVGQMEKTFSWSVPSGVPASLVMASVPLPSPQWCPSFPNDGLHPLPQPLSLLSGNFLGQQRVPERLYQSSSVGSWTNFACTPPPRMDIRTAASPTLITVILQYATLLRPHLKSASEEAMMGADGGRWAWEQGR